VQGHGVGLEKFLPLFVVNQSIGGRMFVLSTSIGYVRSIRHPNGVVVTSSASAAKKFATSKKAEQFVERYSDCGYGLNSGDVTIKEVV
jgi:hypothetical protein